MVTAYIKLKYQGTHQTKKEIGERFASLFLVFSPMVFLIHYLQNANCKTIFTFLRDEDIAVKYLKEE